jgi:hypothetical protein
MGKWKSVAMRFRIAYEEGKNDERKNERYSACLSYRCDGMFHAFDRDSICPAV